MYNSNHYRKRERRKEEQNRKIYQKAGKEKDTKQNSMHAHTHKMGCQEEAQTCPWVS